MNAIKKVMDFLRKDESGAVTIEYVAIAVLVGILAVGALGTIQTTVSARVAQVSLGTATMPASN